MSGAIYVQILIQYDVVAYVILCERLATSWADERHGQGVLVLHLLVILGLLTNEFLDTSFMKPMLARLKVYDGVFILLVVADSTFEPRAPKRHEAL